MTRTRLRNAVVGGLCAAALLAAALTSCGDDGGEAPPSVDPVSLDQLIEACVVTSGCGVKVWPKVLNCLDAYYDLAKPRGSGPVFDRIYQCVIAAQGDCTKVFDCYGSNRYAGSCDNGNFTATCEGDSRYTCDTIAHKVFISDCAVAKLSCKTSTSPPVTAHCTRGACKPTSFKTTCEGSILVSCLASGVIQTDDCGVDGGKCGKSAMGALSCIGNQDKTCDFDSTKPPFQASCDGHSAVTCKNNNVNKEDCSKRPFKRVCRNGTCASSGGECTADDFNKCQGDKLQYCREGKWVALDCASLGLGACKQAVNGANCSAKNW